MTEDDGEKGRRSAPRQGSGGNNTQALSAALRANLQRRKARERALRAKPEAARQEPASDVPEATSEATWTE